MKELFMVAFVITAPIASKAGDESAAIQAIAEASYKQSGLENDVNKIIELNMHYVPKRVQAIVGNSFIVGKMIAERKASYTWTY